MSDVPLLAEYSFLNPDVSLGLEVLSVDRLRQRLSPMARSALHRADFHQIFVVSSGAVETVVDFTKLTCSSGSVIHVRPGQVVHLPTDAAPKTLGTAVLFTSFFPQTMPQLENVLGPIGSTVHQLEGREAAALSTAITELEATYGAALEGQQEPALTFALLRQMLGVVLLRLAMAADPMSVASRSSATETVHRFRTELERSFAVTREAAAYAHRLGYSPRTLNRACVSVTGHSVKDVIDARVVLEAKRLLAHTNVAASSVARRLGFSDAANFTKFFVRNAGTTPGEFRAEHQTIPVEMAADWSAHPNTPGFGQAG